MRTNVVLTVAAAAAAEGRARMAPQRVVERSSDDISAMSVEWVWRRTEASLAK